MTGLTLIVKINVNQTKRSETKIIALKKQAIKPVMSVLLTPKIVVKKIKEF